MYNTDTVFIHLYIVHMHVLCKYFFGRIVVIVVACARVCVCVCVCVSLSDLFPNTVEFCYVYELFLLMTT